MFSFEPPHLAEQKQDDQLEPTYGSSVMIRDVALRTYQKRWTIGRSGERGSRISVQMAWHDEDDDDFPCILKVIAWKGNIVILCGQSPVSGKWFYKCPLGGVVKRHVNANAHDPGCELANPCALCRLVKQRVILFTQPLRSGRIWHKINF